MFYLFIYFNNSKHNVTVFAYLLTHQENVGVPGTGAFEWRQ